MSPDFRQRASSNASSVGRLSPIPSLIGLEPDWSFTPPGLPQAADYTDGPEDMVNDDGTNQMGLVHSTALDQLAGSLADELTLQKDFLQGSVLLFIVYKYYLF